jgi:hypothetical protein
MASQDPTPHVEKLKQLLSSPHIFDRHSKSYLGYFYAFSGDSAAAKGLFFDDFTNGLDLLSDECEGNGYEGYLYLVDIFMHFGDYLNALSAW